MEKLSDFELMLLDKILEEEVDFEEEYTEEELEEAYLYEIPLSMPSK